MSVLHASRRRRSRWWVASTAAVGLLAFATIGPAAAGTPRVLQSVRVGHFPGGDATSPDGSKVYVTNFNDNTVSVISTRTGVVSRVIGVGTAPLGIAVSRDGRTAYVAEFGDGALSVIDTASGTVTHTIAVTDATDPEDNATNVVLSPDGSTAYVTTYGGALSVVDLRSDTLRDLSFVGDYPGRPAVSPDGSSLYVPTCRPAAIQVFDTASNTVARTLPGGSCNARVALSPDGSTAYVASGTAGEGGVQVLRTATGRLIRTVDAADSLFDLAVTPDGSTLVGSVLGGSGTATGQVAVIDTVSGSVRRRVPVGPAPEAVAIAPDGYTAYVTDARDNTVSVIDTGLAPPPRITAQPAAVTVGPGGSATFTVAVSGPLSPTVRWQSRGPHGYWNDVPGADTTTWTTGPLSPADSGRAYRAIATNREGSISSQAGTVTVAG